MRLQYYFIVVAVSLLVAGCTVGPKYVKRQLKTEPVYAEMTDNETTNPPPKDWWKTFNDPELDKLINEALQQNFDLRMAYTRIREARFQRNIVAADLFPQVDADAGYGRARGSKNVILPLGGSGGSGGSASSHVASSKTSQTQSTARSVSQPSGSQSSGTQPAGSAGTQGGGQNDSAFDDQLSPFGKGGLPGVSTDLYQVGFDANWEIDVFGSKRRQVEAANADTQAAREERQRIALTTMAEVARNYFELRGLQMRLDIARQNLEAQSNIWELTRSQARSGLAAEADVVRARAEVETTSADTPPLEQQAKTLMHALAILVGSEPTALSEELAKGGVLPPKPPMVSVGLPSQLLERRPDIREAERQVAAANARIGSAKADLFPKFALIASTGLDSTSAENLFSWDSRYFLISPTVTWRIFDAGRIISNIRLQQALTDEADLQYQYTLLQALQEVEDALVNYAGEQEHLDRLAAASKQDEITLDLARQRYEHGLVSFLEVLDAERTELSAQDQVAQSTATSTVDLVALYKALGGGWK